MSYEGENRPYFDTDYLGNDSLIHLRRIYPGWAEDDCPLIAKYCTDPAWYAEYRVIFRQEFDHMRSLQRKMERRGEDYTKYFPRYVCCRDRLPEYRGYPEDLHPGAPCLVMEYIPGETLEERLKRSGPGEDQNRTLRRFMTYRGGRGSGNTCRCRLEPQKVAGVFRQLYRMEHLLGEEIGALQLDLSAGNLILKGDDSDFPVRLIDLTDLCYLSEEEGKRREACGHPGYKISCGELRTDCSLSRQLGMAEALLFVRLFYPDEETRLREDSFRNPLFSRQGYGLLMTDLEVAAADRRPGIHDPAEDGYFGFFDRWYDNFLNVWNV